MFASWLSFRRLLEDASCYLRFVFERKRVSYLPEISLVNSISPATLQSSLFAGSLCAKFPRSGQRDIPFQFNRR